MIVEVGIRILTDDGLPMMLAEARELYVHKAPDFETNLFGALALLDQTIEHEKERMLHQAQEYRQSEFQLARREGRTPGEAPPRPPERM